MKFSSPYLDQVLGWIEPNMPAVFKDDTKGYVKSIEYNIITVYCIDTDVTTSILLGKPSSPEIMLPYFVKSIDGKIIKDLFS